MEVKKRVILLFACLCSATTSSMALGYESISSYVMFLNYGTDVEAGIELFLLQNPKYQKYDEWLNLNLGYPNHHPKLDSFYIDLCTQNYYLDAFHHKRYVIYDEQEKIYYSIMVLKGIGSSLVWTYPMGWEVCIMGFLLNDGRFANKLTKDERKVAIKNFEKQILPQIKEYIKKAKNETQ